MVIGIAGMARNSSPHAGESPAFCANPQHQYTPSPMVNRHTSSQAGSIAAGRPRASPYASSGTSMR
jgi:hypothetical protein